MAGGGDGKGSLDQQKLNKLIFKRTIYSKSVRGVVV